jgi:hypothetical protein
MFETLYGRRCQAPLFWSEAGERKRFGPDILQEAEKQVHMVRENLWVAQSRQKSYVDHSRKELSFEVRDFVYLKVSPMRGCIVSRYEASSHLNAEDLFHRFFNRKNNSLILKIHRPWKFYKNTPKLFQNYILVLENLHIGLCLTFYNYN